MRTEGQRKFFTAKEAAEALEMTTGQLMKLVDAGEIFCIDLTGNTLTKFNRERTEDMVEFEQCDFDKFLEQKAERARLSEILAGRPPSGAKEWALLRRHQQEQAMNAGRNRGRNKRNQRQQKQTLTS